MSLHTNWIFTLNNYTDEDVERIHQNFPEHYKYVIFGKEIAPTTGTPHLQGYLQLVSRRRLTGMKKLMPRANLQEAKGSAAQNLKYCSKDANVTELGESTTAGQRSDLEDFKEAVKSGELSLKRLREDYSDVCAKYPRFVREYVSDKTPQPHLEVHPLRLWQEDLNRTLNLPPGDRKIIFVVDPKGNQGKTWFAKYYCSLHENAQILEAAKKADMAYALDNQIRVLFVNCVRKTTEFLQYGFLEAVKDGIVFSAKYESGNKLIGACHVVVLMNQQPDMEALSEDRYEIYNI